MKRATLGNHEVSGLRNKGMKRATLGDHEVNGPKNKGMKRTTLGITGSMVRGTRA